MVVGGVVLEFERRLVVVTVISVTGESGREVIELESEAGWAYSGLGVRLTG